jgi:hypothetical protein
MHGEPSVTAHNRDSESHWLTRDGGRLLWLWIAKKIC